MIRITYHLAKKEFAMHRLFVYGSLRSHGKNHPTLSDGPGEARFVGAASTVLCFPLILVPPFFSPPMLDAPGHGFRVQGELWDVDAVQLATLDELEQVHHPRKPFHRTRIQVQYPDGPQGMAEVYLFTHVNWQRLLPGHPKRYVCYDAYTPEMAAKYVPVADRPAMVDGDPVDIYINAVLNG